MFSNQIQRSRKIAGDGNALDRPKFLGFVGVQTGFESADRRQALRSTWFPSDPEGLLRFGLANFCGKFLGKICSILMIGFLIS